MPIGSGWRTFLVAGGELAVKCGEFGWFSPDTGAVDQHGHRWYKRDFETRWRRAGEVDVKQVQGPWLEAEFRAS